MADDRSAGLKLYSLGIVLQAKVRGSDTIMVDPIEALSMDNGAIGADTKNKKVALPDQHGVSRNSEIKGGSAIKAKWLPFGHSNRESAPDVQPSETVILFSYADTQDFYWTTIFREPTLRRLETVRHMYSNQSGGQAEYDDDTAYWFEISTHDKTIKLHTSDNDGEACKYDLVVDAGKGTIELTDSVGNSVVLESPAGNLTATVTNNITLNCKRFFVNAEERIEFFTPTFISHATKTIINSKEKLTLGYDPSEDSESSATMRSFNSPTNEVLIMAQTTNIESTQSVTTTTTDITTTSSSITESADSVTQTFGNVQQNAQAVSNVADSVETKASTVKVTAKTSINGDVSVSGDVDIGGDVDVSGRLSASSITG